MAIYSIKVTAHDLPQEPGTSIGTGSGLAGHVKRGEIESLLAQGSSPAAKEQTQKHQSAEIPSHL
jgi:hypothetical protein